MNEHDLVIQRFLDHELSPEERTAFLQAVDANSDLRRRWLNLEMVAVEAAQLPKIVPSAQFLSRLKAQVIPAPPSLLARLCAAVTAHRTLEWNFAGAMAAACVAVVAVAGLLSLKPERIVEVPVTVTPAQTASIGAPSDPKVFVRLILVQPNAQSVSVAGDFNGWNPAQTKLDRTDGGVWTVTIPLKPGRYEYMFVVNGKQWIADPFAAEDAGDGFGSHNAVLDVAI